ncbi:MAG: metal-dependent transcriptional regulator [Halodesulfurarchaeum sp.]
MELTDHPEPVQELPNRNAGRYLRTILLSVDGPTDEVRPIHIADQLDVSPASVTEMTNHLADAGYVDHEPYGGISLTRKGASMARHLQWRQCVFVQFLESTLDVEVPGMESYEASFALPADVLERAREFVGIECKQRCNDRVWEESCTEHAQLAPKGTDTANGATKS